MMSSLILAQAAAEDNSGLQEMMDTFISWIATNALNIVIAIVIFIVGKWVAKLLTSVTKHLMSKSKMDEALVNFLGHIVNALLMVIVIIAALNQAGFATTSLVAIVGAAGLAVGLALQGSLANFASGVMIIMFRPFTKGDVICAGGVTGCVEEITIFTTNMKTPDNKAIIVPNGAIMGGSITNFSAKDTRRVDFVFGVSYGDDIKKVKEVIWEVLNADERILKDPAPTVGLLELADSSVNFAVRPWVNSGDYWGVFFDIQEKMKIRFDEEGISIPFPQQDVHMHQVDPKAAK